jgi:hypothetical protein
MRLGRAAEPIAGTSNVGERNFSRRRAVVDTQHKGGATSSARLAGQGAFFEQLTIADLLQVATTDNQE